MSTKVNIPMNNLGCYKIPSSCKKNVCVDIGANVGSFTMSQHANFQVVHYYEPFKECYSIIQEKVKFLKNVSGWQEAVYKEDNKTVSILKHYYLDAGSNAIKTDSLNNDWQEEIGTATTVSFPTVLKRAGGHIDYLKIDCETSEYYFLIDQDLSSIDYIGMELHWQMGEKRYNELLNHIFKTHITQDNCSWRHQLNREVLLTPIKKNF